MKVRYEIFCEKLSNALQFFYKNREIYENKFRLKMTVH